MKIDTKAILTKLLSVVRIARQYSVFIFVITLLCVWGLLVIRINSLNNQKPNQEDIADKLKTAQRPKIDQSVIDKIQQLQDNSTNVQSLFNKARDNPFQE